MTADINEMIQKVAQQTSVEKEALANKMQVVLGEQSAAWSNAGKTAEQINVLALRVAARQIVAEKNKLSRSGCDALEGFFATMPNYKDWGKLLYNKMKGTLSSLDETGREALVSQGAVVIFEDNHDGSYTKHYNPSLVSGKAFEVGHDTQDVNELDSRAMQLRDSIHFYLVWDKNTPKFPSGDKNFKYGIARPQQELERTSLFYGRKVGTNDEFKLITIKATGDIASEQYPTFQAGTIPVRMGRNGVGYAKKGVTKFTTDDSIANKFDAPPCALSEEGVSGIVPTLLGNDFLTGFSGLEDFHSANFGQAGWWDKFVGLIAEVVHIDPTDKGGYIMTLADLDITSSAPVVEFRIPESQASLVNFGVGSQLMVTGQCWKSKEGEVRFSTQGWFCVDAIAPVDSSLDDDGWDAE